MKLVVFTEKLVFWRACVILKKSAFLPQLLYIVVGYYSRHVYYDTLPLGVFSAPFASLIMFGYCTYTIWLSLCAHCSLCLMPYQLRLHLPIQCKEKNIRIRWRLQLLQLFLWWFILHLLWLTNNRWRTKQRWTVVFKKALGQISVTTEKSQILTEQQ